MVKGNNNNKRAQQPANNTSTVSPATAPQQPLPKSSTTTTAPSQQVPLPEPPVSSLVEITVSNDLASFLDAAIDVLISKSVVDTKGSNNNMGGDDKFVQPLCAATLLQLQDWLVRTAHQWSLLPSLRGHTSTGDYTVKSFVKFSCEVLVPMLAAATSSSTHAVTRLRAMMKQVYGSCVWRSLVDKRSTLKDELQEAITRRRNYSLTTNTTTVITTSSSSSSPLLLSEEDFLAVVRPHILNGTSTVGLELTIPAPLLQTVLETLRHVNIHHPDTFTTVSNKSKSNNNHHTTTAYNWEAVMAESTSSWLSLVKYLNGLQTTDGANKCGTTAVVVSGGGQKSGADPWLWFSGMHVYEGVSTTNGDGEGEGVTTHDDLFAPVKNSAIDGMHVDSRLVASSSLKYLQPTSPFTTTLPTPASSGAVVTTTKRGGGGHDDSTSLLDVSSLVYNMFLLPQDRYCSVRLQPSRKSNTTSTTSTSKQQSTTTTATSSYTSNLPPTFADSSNDKVKIHISNVVSALEYYRHVDLPLFLRNVEGKCGRLMSVFLSIMVATDSFGRAGTAVGEGDDNGDVKRRSGVNNNNLSNKSSSALTKPYQPMSHADRMTAIIKAFGSEAEPVLSMVVLKGSTEAITPQLLLTAQAEKRAVSNLSLITSATSSTSPSQRVNLEGYLKIREARDADDKKRESHLKGLLVINEAIEDSAYRSQITGGNNNNNNSSSSSGNNTHQQGSTGAQQLASAQEVGIKNETLSSFLKEASIAFDMRIMSLAAAIVGYAMAHFRGMSPGVCVVFAAVCAALMTMVDALLLFTRLTKDDQARSKKVRSEEFANRAKERKRL